MRTYILLVLIALTSFLAKSQPLDLFQEANAKYQEEAFDQAIVLYDSIVSLGYSHAETYYNLGNAHYRLGHVGLAILNYERALQIDPNDEDARHNLELGNKQVVDEFNVVPTPPLGRVLRDVSSIASSTFWTILALALFLEALILALFYLLKSRSTVLVVLFSISLIIGALAEGVAYASHTFEQEQFAIITVANTYVKSAPAKTASDLYILHEGTKVKVLETFEGWDKVRMPDGKIGWLQQRDLGLI